MEKFNKNKEGEKFRKKYLNPEFNSKFQNKDEIQKEISSTEYSLKNMKGNEIPHAKSYLQKLNGVLDTLEEKTKEEGPFSSLKNMFLNKNQKEMNDNQDGIDKVA